MLTNPGFVEEHPDWRIEEREKPGAPGDLIQEHYRMYEFANYGEAWKIHDRGRRAVYSTPEPSSSLAKYLQQG
jgi:hypothetical protein